MTKPPGIPDSDVMKMKPSFKERYGSNWKKVLYSTLWKRHNEDVVYEEEGKKVVHIHYHPDYEEFRVPSGSKAKGAGYFTNDKEDAEATARHIHGKDIVIKHSRKRYNTEETRLAKVDYIWENVHQSRKVIAEGQRCISILHEGKKELLSLEGAPSDLVDLHYHNIRKIKGVTEDAVDDQLKRHGFSRVELSKKVQPQRQQFQGRPLEPQHSARNEAWAGDSSGANATDPKKRGMFKGRSLSSLEAQDKHVSGTKKKQVDFAIRAKTGWGKVR